MTPRPPPSRRILLFIGDVLPGLGLVLFGALVFVVVFSPVLFNRHDGRTFTCTFIVDERFRGGFMLRSDTNADPKTTNLTFRVNEKGEVRSNYSWVFSRAAYRVVSARWTSGKNLPVDMLGDSPKDQMALRSPDVVTSDGAWFVVGTHADWGHFLNGAPKVGPISPDNW